MNKYKALILIRLELKSIECSLRNIENLRNIIPESQILEELQKKDFTALRGKINELINAVPVNAL